jgi:hypothetical protein
MCMLQFLYAYFGGSLAEETDKIGKKIKRILCSSVPRPHMFLGFLSNVSSVMFLGSLRNISSYVLSATWLSNISLFLSPYVHVDLCSEKPSGQFLWLIVMSH